MRHRVTTMFTATVLVIGGVMCVRPVPESRESPPGEGWTEHDGHLYKVLYHAPTYDAAESSCQAEGGHLASIHSQADNDFVYGLIKRGKTSSDFHDFTWIGLRRYEDAFDWKWADGTAVDYLHWADKQPNNFDGRERCVQIWTSHSTHGVWNDYNCTQKMDSYVCKI